MSTKEHKSHAPKKVQIGIVTVSTTRTLAEDESGHWISKRARKEKHEILFHKVVKDDAAVITATVVQAIREQDPPVLLLDEPMAGLTSSEKDELIEIILRFKDEFGTSIIIVEHDMRVIINLCDSIVVMNNGRLIAEGTAEEIRNNQDVVEAYLGKSSV